MAAAYAVSGGSIAGRLGGPRAAGVEAAARRRVDRVGRLAADQRAGPRAVLLGVGDRDRRQQGAGVGMDRLGVELLGGRELDQLAQVHDCDPVGDVADDAEVVGDEDVRQAEVVLEVVEQVDDLGLDRDVERRTGSSSTISLRIDGERAGDADPLALTAGELVREAVDVLGVEADALQQLAHARVDLAAVHAPQPQRAPTIWPTRLRGFSEDAGSWKTICTSRRSGPAPRRPRWVMSCPWKRMAPPVGSSSRRMLRASVVLPQPDSPTNPSVSPSCSASDTSSTACTGRRCGRTACPA